MDRARHPYRGRAIAAPALAEFAGTSGLAAVDAPSDTETDVAGAVERCFALYQEGAHAAAAGAATGAIAAGGPSRPPTELARLWSVLALARHGLGDATAARAALESAIATAPAEERPAYERQLASLAGDIGRELLGRLDGDRAPESELELVAVREAFEWLERGTHLAPGDETLRERALAVEARLWPGYERVATALVQRQQYAAARRLLREALDDARLPAARAETFREVFSAAYAGEIGQLTAHAIRAMHEARDSDAVGALARAEELLETVSDEALPPKRREEVGRRLWWGYKKLARRRAQAGEYEAAADALGHALRFADVGTDRQAETRAALARALEGLVETHAVRIRELADAGDREAALVQSDRLWSRLRRALGDGLGEDDLVVAFSKARQAFDEVGAQP